MGWSLTVKQLHDELCVFLLPIVVEVDVSVLP